MKRGFSTIELAVAGAAMALVFLGLWRFYDYAEGVGYQRASLEAADRRAEQLEAANATIHRLEDERETREREHADAVAAIDAAGTKKLAEVTRAKDQFVSDVVAGRVRLYDPGAKCRGGDSAGHTALAGAGVGNDTGGAELSAEAAGFLAAEAARADQVVVKLTACQAIVRADRPPP